MTEPLVHRLVGSDVAAEILPVGASLHTFEIALPDGGWRNLLQSRTDLTRNDVSFFGATVGRLANRVDAAHITVDGVGYQLAPNEGGNQLHGGPGGFAEPTWEVLRASDEDILLHLVSPDGDQGYPGTLQVWAEYSLIPGGVQVVYSATTDAPTVVNLTTHPYFILGDGTVEDHVITVPASLYTPVRPDQIPTGEIAPVDGTGLDLRAGRVLGEAIAEVIAEGIAAKGGIDHNLVIDGEGLREHVRLTGPTGITVVVRSDAPAVQLYTGEHLGRTAIAIEPQGYPDAPNHPNFPSVALEPGESYSATIQWVLG